MALITNSSEGGTNGTAITAANSGGASGTAWSVDPTTGGGTCRFSSARAFKGSLSSQFIKSGANANYCTWTWANNINVAFRFYVIFDDLPSGGTGFFQLRTNSGGTERLTMTVSNLGVMTVTDGQASPTTIYTSPSSTLAADTWYRVEGSLFVNTTTGAAVFKVFNGDDTVSPIVDQSLTCLSNTATGAGMARIGATSAVTTLGGNGWFYDDMAVNDGTLTLIGPSSSGFTGSFVRVAGGAKARVRVPGGAAASLRLTGGARLQ